MTDTIENLVHASRLNLDAMKEAWHATFDGGERLVALALGASRTIAADGAASATAMLDAADAGELLALELSAGKAAIGRTNEWARDALAIVVERQEALRRIVEPRLADFTGELESILGDASRAMIAGVPLPIGVALPSGKGAGNHRDEDAGDASGTRIADKRKSA